MFNCGRAVGLVRDAVGMPGRASPQVGVGRCEDDAGDPTSRSAVLPRCRQNLR